MGKKGSHGKGSMVDVGKVHGGGGGDLGGLVRMKGGAKANSVQIPKPTR